jgi:hypothetical protein
MNNLDLLRKACIDDYPIFTLKGYITYAKLLSNYDGDTGDILFIYNEKPMRMKARFLGYDTNEIKPSLNDPRRDEKKRKAKLAKERLWELCRGNNNLIRIRCEEFDKYGRLLIIAFDENFNGELTFDNSINNKMIEEGHGYSYDGGTKLSDF